MKLFLPTTIIFLSISWLFLDTIGIDYQEPWFSLVLLIFGAWCLTGWLVIFNALERIYGS